jgi:hypothetical protein
MIANDQPTTSDNRHRSISHPRKKTTTGTAEPKPERIRAELNIEKWPAIWNPTHSKIHSKLNTQSRTLERESTGPDGTRTASTVTINPIAQLGDLTTDDQRTLYALIKHWEERGKPQHETPFSIRHMAKLLHKKGWGTNVIDAVTGSLERLRGTMLVWTRSYRSKDERVEDLETVYVNILSKLKIVRRKIDGHVTTEAGYFQFDDHILKNLLNNYTKPFLFEVFIDIKGEIALKLYSYLDLIMADKNRFERCTRELFEDLGLKGSSYRNPSKRKQNLEKAFAELTGIMLTTGVLKSATIERTKDGKDYKAVFQKIARSAFAAEELKPATTFTSPEPVVINHYSKQKDALTLQAEELVHYFHKLFHAVTSHVAQSKETSQALSLISQHGLEKAKSVVEFARNEAAKTNFPIQHFGAILSYTSRAVASFDRQATTEKHPPIPESIRSAPQEVRWPKGEGRLKGLTAEQYAQRFEKTKLALFQETPFLAHSWKEGSQLHQSMIRNRIVRDLGTEPMDLLPLSLLPTWYRLQTQNLQL